MVKKSDTTILLLGALLIGGYMLLKGGLQALPNLAGGLGNWLGGLFGGGGTTVTIQEAPTEVLLETHSAFEEAPPEIFRYDPFNILPIFYTEIYGELETRGIAPEPRPPVDIYDPKLIREQYRAGYVKTSIEVQPSEVLETIVEAPAKDPFGISVVIQQKAEQELTRREKRVAKRKAMQRITRAGSTEERLIAMRQLIEEKRRGDIL